MPQEYPTQCWSCLGEFDAASAVWCTCSARTPTKLCPFCFHCFCQADAAYQDSFWNRAPAELREEREILKRASGSVGETLIRSNLLNTDQLVSALKWQQSRGGSLDHALVELGFVSRDNLEVVERGSSKGRGTIDLSHQLVDATLIKAISVDVCVRKKVLPISREQIGEASVLTLAMARLADVDTIDQVQSLTGCRIIPLGAPERAILDRLEELYPDEVRAALAPEEELQEIEEAPSGSAPARHAAPRKPPGSEPRRGRASAPAPAPSRGRAARPQAAAAAGSDAAPRRAAPAPADTAAGALQKVLAEAMQRNASSIQMEIRGASLTLYYRIDGTLMRARPPAGLASSELSGTLSSMASLPGGDGPASGRLSVKAGGRKIDMVVRRLPFQGGESLLVQIVDPAAFRRDLESLGVSALDRERILKALALPSGLIVLSGPPHNDLEVTRYSLMEQAGREGRRVLAIESPQLLSVDGVRHQEIPYPTDPERVRGAVGAAHGAEVLFLPDIESAELAALAVERAESCLVVAAVQARRASQTPAALLWHQLEPGALSAALKLVINQRLVRRICDGCRSPVQANERILKMMGLTADEALDLKTFLGSGCERCGSLGQGYRGRVALFEVLEVTPDMASLIAATAPPGEIERLARQAGMSPLRAACLARVGQGLTTLEEFQKGNF
ncbi:MAG: GspE/PulE family protein [Acidobacteriota bacterium]